MESTELSSWQLEMALAVSRVPLSVVASVAKLLQTCRNQGATLYTYGNGGSGSIASHFAGDLLKNVCNRVVGRLHAVCLSDNPTAYSAFVNDGVAHEAPSAILDAYRDAVMSDLADVVFIISSSGESSNVVHLAEYCLQEGITVVALTGVPTSRLASLADYTIAVGGPEYRYNEPMFSAICHLIIHLIQVADR